MSFDKDDICEFDQVGVTCEVDERLLGVSFARGANVMFNGARDIHRGIEFTGNPGEEVLLLGVGVFTSAIYRPETLPANVTRLTPRSREVYQRMLTKLAA